MTGRVNIGELILGLPGVDIHGDAKVEICGIAYDSRKVNPGDLFVAVPGTKDDGAKYVPMAIEAGAAAVLSRNGVKGLDVTAVTAADVRLAMGIMAARRASSRVYRSLSTLMNSGMRGTGT